MDSSLVNEISREWEAEDVPDPDFLFMRVHYRFLDQDGEPMPGAFRNRPDESGGMSVDWQKYSTPQETRARARDPSANIVIEFLAGAVRKIPNQTVVHTPDADRYNRAHTDIRGEKKRPVEIRERFMEVYRKVAL